MAVLIACECSQVVCSAFRREGHEAYSCDIVPCYGGHPEWHIIYDAQLVVRGHGVFPLEDGAQLVCPGYWDMIVAHPPCTMLTHSSAVALSKGLHSYEDIERAACFFWDILHAPCRFVAVENPAPMRAACLPPYDQIVQPYQYGHEFSKRLCLWLRGLPQLLPMTAEMPHKQWIKHCAGNARRRSKTFEGVAEAMAKQWGGLLWLRD